MAIFDPTDPRPASKVIEEIATGIENPIWRKKVLTDFVFEHEKLIEAILIYLDELDAANRLYLLELQIDDHEARILALEEAVFGPSS